MPLVSFKLNGKAVSVNVDGTELLVDTIRQRFMLTGTKKACGTDDCGACTVLVNGIAVRSCAYLTCMAEGSEILTVEGLAKDGKLHPVQQAFVDAGAIQCGYCTPGMVMTAVALLNEEKDPTEESIRRAISGNLCRCTGYQKIVDAVRLGAARLRNTPDPTREEVGTGE